MNKTCAIARCESALILVGMQYLFQRDWFLRLFNDFIKARVVAQRIPPRMQPQLPVRDWAVDSHDLLQLFKRKILFTCPRVSDGQISQDLRASHRVFCDWKKFSGMA